MKGSIVIILVFSIVAVVNSQWIKQTNPENTFLHSVFMVDEDIAYAVGGLAKGYMIKTTDGGGNWEVIPSFTNAILHDVHFLNKDTGYVSGQFGVIFKTTDAGINWSLFQTGTNQVITAIDFVDDNTGFACGTGGVFFKTTNAGAIWEKIDLPGNAFSFSALDFLDANNGFLIGSPSFKTTDGGLSWQEMTFQYSTPTDIFMIDAQAGFVSRYGSADGGIYKTTNGGNTWTLYAGTISEPLSGIFFTSPETGYACGGFYSPPNGPSSYVVKTTNGGESWFEQETQFGSNLLSLYFSSNLKGIAVGGSLIAGTENGGNLAINTDNSKISSNFTLSQNYPNPFNPTTTIRYNLPEMSNVEIYIYNLLGAKIATLINEEQQVGAKEVAWNGTDYLGRAVSAGIYIYQIRSGDFTESKKMILMR